jgi:cell division protein FtsZ
MKGAKGVIISITGGEDMRLMEVDEAASHIKELVDPDANIIWGSAFNNDLDGKIRVSVVATGIEAEAAQQPQSTGAGKVFTFPNARSSVAAAAPRIAPAPAPEPVQAPELEASAEDDLLELGHSDELVLDSDDILTSPVAPAPIAPPSDDDFSGASDQPQAAAPAREAGTLFERMSNIARGAAQAKVDEENATAARRDPLDIPRFLNRQNNQ